MTALYRNIARYSMLVPIQSDPEWTDLDRVLCDQLPGVAGLGAVQTAAQALKLSINDAAHLVAGGGNSNVSAATLIKTATRVFSAGASAGGNSWLGKLGIYSTRIPIPPSIGGATALLGGDPTRVSLLIQNNTPAGAGAANLLVSIDGSIDTASPWAYLNLAPGEGIYQDQNAWTNPIYVAWASGTPIGGVLFSASEPADGSNNSAGASYSAPVSLPGAANTTSSF